MGSITTIKEPATSLRGKLDYDTLTNEITLQNLYAFTYGTETIDTVKTQSKLSNKNDIQTVINNSIKAFNKFMEEDGKKLDKFQQEKEEKLFYTFLYAMEKIWTKLLDKTGDEYNKVITALREPSGTQEDVQNKSILLPYLSKQTFDQAKKDAIFKAVPLKAVGQQLASYFAGPTNKLSSSLEKLIKLWVPYRFLYYTVYDEDPNQIENFKDKIFEFETEQEVSSRSFDRMMLAFIQLLQMASINDEYQRAILKDLDSIFTGYQVKKNGGADKLDVVAYVQDIYKNQTKEELATVINASQILTDEMKTVLLYLSTDMDAFLRTRTTAEQLVIPGAMDAILNALDMGVVVSKVEDLLKAVAITVTGKTVEGTSESDKVVGELVTMLKDSVLRVEGLLKSVKGVSQSLPAQGGPTSTTGPGTVVLQQPPTRDLLVELRKLYPNTNCTQENIDSQENAVIQIINDTKAVRSAITKDINKAITQDDLDKLYKNNSTITDEEKVKVGEIELLDCTKLEQSKAALEKLKSHIDTISRVRVVLSFNENVSKDNNTDIYKDDNTINSIVKGEYTVNGSNITPFYRYLSKTKQDDITSFTDDIKKDIETAKTKPNTNIIYTGYGHSGSGKTYTLTEAANANNVLGVIFEELNKNGGDDVTLSVYELYGEDKDRDDKCTAEPFEKIYEYNLETIIDIQSTTDLVTPIENKTKLTKSINLNKITELKDIITRIDSIRKQDFNELITPPMSTDTVERHIIKTPNNLDSSRGHMFYEFTVPVDSGKSKITVIDMGGVEDVNKIEKEYYDTKKYFPTDTNAEFKLSTIQITQFKSGIPDKELPGKIKQFITTPLQNSISTLDQQKLEVLYPKVDIWNKLVEQPDNKIVSDYKESVDKIIKIGDNIIGNVVLDTLVKPSVSVSRGKEVINSIDDFITKLILPPGANQTNSINKYITGVLKKFYTLTSNPPSQTISLSRNSDINITYLDSNDVLVCHILLSDIQDYLKKPGDKTMILTNLYKVSTAKITEYTNFIKPIIESSKDYIYTDQAVTNFNRYKLEFEKLIKKYNCPLRRQGNYINRSIEDLKDFTYTLAGISNPPPSQPQTELKKLLPDLSQNNTKQNTKLTIIAALRTDEAHKDDMNKTLYFAHCINPFSNKTGDYIKCTDPANMKGGKSKKQKAGAPQQTSPPETTANPIATLQAKLTEDIDTVKSYLKKSNELKQVLADVTSTWKAYTSVTEQKSFKDLKISLLLDSLIGEMKKPIGGLQTGDAAKQYNVFNTGTLDTGKYNKNKDYIFGTPIKNSNSDYIVYNFDINTSNSLKSEFEKKRKDVVSQLEELRISLDNNTKIFPNTNSRNEIVAKLASKLKDLVTIPAIDTKPEALIEQFLKASSSNEDYYVVDTEKITEFLDQVRKDYNAVEGYTAEEVKGTNSYLQKSAEPLKKDLVDKLTKVSTEYSKLIEELTKQAKKYAEVNPSIKNKVLLLLEPKDGSPSTTSKIMERINYLMGKMKADIDINKSSFEKAAEGMKSDKKSGGGYLLCNHEFLMQGGGVKEDRDEIADVLLKDKTDIESIYKYINEFETLTKTFVNNLQKSTDPTYALTTQGNESLFNTLFNKYRESKADTSKGEYQAALELSEGLEANNLLPRKVLAITYLDKSVFIFATLFMRLIALTIIDYLIDHDKLKRLSFTFLTYLGIYIGIFYVLLLVVNLDDYKLRIIFNYMNMHANASVAALHPALVAVFGGIIYYVMLNINKGYGYTVASDEDRVRLKYKIQVLSLVIWMFTSLLVLLM